MLSEWTSNSSLGEWACPSVGERDPEHDQGADERKYRREDSWTQVAELRTTHREGSLLAARPWRVSPSRMLRFGGHDVKYF